jgi:hypothetical protein
MSDELKKPSDEWLSATLAWIIALIAIEAMAGLWLFWRYQNLLEQANR